MKAEDPKEQPTVQTDTQGAAPENRPKTTEEAENTNKEPVQEQEDNKAHNQEDESGANEGQNMDPSKKIDDEGEGEAGNYNLRKRPRKENPYYYCELSDGDDANKGEGRKRQKKFEEDYDPNQDVEEDDYKSGKQGNNQPNMNQQQNMAQNNMNNQMMMQQMMNRNQQNMMGMAGLNDTSAALNQMMGPFGANPAGMGMRPDQMATQMNQNFNQNTMQTQMAQNDPKQVCFTKCYDFDRLNFTNFRVDSFIHFSYLLFSCINFEIIRNNSLFPIRKIFFIIASFRLRDFI